MRATKRSIHIRLLLVLLMLGGASLACWSSDTLFIPPTATPTVTPVPPTPNVNSLYKPGDTVRVISQGIAPVYLTEKPEPLSRRNRVPNAACFADTTVTILAVQQVDDVTYYEITCNNIPGWVPEDRLGEP